MSYVTDVVVHVDYAPDEARRQFVELFEFEPYRVGGLQALDETQAGGNKAFQGDIYAGAFNYLNVDALVDWFVNLPWGNTGQAVLSTSSEGESFRVVVIRDGRAHERGTDNRLSGRLQVDGGVCRDER